jgi:spermidine synthase
MIDESPVVLARAEGPHGETVLRRRGDVTELVVNGVFAMDTEETTTEAALATLTLERLPGDGPLRVCVGGLGLGVTARTLLADPRVGRLDVVELDAALAGWVRAGLVPGTEGLLADDRVRLHVGDVAAVVPTLGAAALDAVLLDVDNGPEFLVHDANAPLYEPGFLARAAGTLRAGGVLAVWSAEPSPALAAAMTAACGPCEEVTLPVRRGRHEFAYAVYLSRRVSTATRPCRPATS